MAKTDKTKIQNRCTKDELIAKFDEAMYEFIKGGGSVNNMADMLFSVYALMWKTAPHKIYLSDYPVFLKEHKISLSQKHKCIDDEAEKMSDRLSYTIYDNTIISASKKLDELGIIYYIYAYDGDAILITATGEIIFDAYGDPNILMTSTEIPEWFVDSLVIAEDDSATYNYLTYDKDGFSLRPLDIKKCDVDLKLNYNDDLPHQEIVDFLNGNECGLVILHGMPGSGKTTYIRHLITTLNKEFIYLDASAFDYINDGSFISTMADYTNAVIILEDCENILIGHDIRDSRVGVLLNMTDGLLGDAFKLKIICTFNADIRDIDDALLRKGRLQQKYEFKELTEDKVKTLANHIGKDIPDDELEPMVLSDIYGYGTSVGDLDDGECRVGFLK